MNLSTWIRQSHRWLSIVFTATVTINVVAIAAHAYSSAVGLVAVVPIFLLSLTGVYLFALPYAAKRRRADRIPRSGLRE